MLLGKYMSTLLIVFIFLTVLVTVCVIPAYSGLKERFHRLPLWLPFVLIIFILIAFFLVPTDSQATVQMFRALH